MNNNLQKIESNLKNGGWFRVAFLGDSITSTEWVYPNWRGIVEFVLKEKMEEVMGSWEIPCWKIRTYNAGFNGASTKDMIDYVDEEISMYKPNLVIFMDTYNDKYSDIQPEKHKENLDVIFNKLFGITENLVFTTSISGLDEKANDEDKQYITAANEVAKKYKEKIQFIDVFSKYAEFDLKKIFTFVSENGNVDAGIEPGAIDFGHPNQLGNAYIAKIMLKEIFDVDFDPELYIKETLDGKKYPSY